MNGVECLVDWGTWRPRVVLPAEARDWDLARQRAVLAHELAHIQRFDCLNRMLGRAALALHWFNPLAWLALRRLRVESEQACDDRVLDAGAVPADYAELLLAMAGRLRCERWLGAAAIAMARRSQLEGRLLAVLDAARSRAGVTRRGVAGALVVAGCVLGPVSAIRLTARAEAADPPDSAVQSEPQLAAARDMALEGGDL